MRNRGGVRDGREFEALAWPASQLGDAMVALASKSGLWMPTCEAVNPTPLSSTFDAGAWIEWHAQLLGGEAEQVETTLGNLGVELATTCPGLLRLSPSSYLALLGGRRGMLRILTPNLAMHSVSIKLVYDAIREPAEGASRREIDQALDRIQISRSRESKIETLLVNEQLEDSRFNQYWILRSPPGARPVPWLREAHFFTNLARLLGAHALQYLLWIASWAILGALSFKGRMDHAWLWAWALLLMTLVPFRAFTTWLQGSLAIGIGAILKRRLLCGALRLTPEEVRHQGIGDFLGQVFEAEALETLALNGGVAGLLAAIELVISAIVLGRFAALLLVWCCVTGILAWSFLHRHQRWTTLRMDMTQDLVEAMVGHRTRLAQQPREEWHEAEDRMLNRYIESSRSMDRSAAWLIAAIPRGWLLAGLACLGPSIVSARTPPIQIAVVLGGFLLAFAGFKRFAGAFVGIASAWVLRKRVSPLFRAAARPERLAEIFTGVQTGEPSQKVIEADRLTFRYDKFGNPALQACSLVVRRGERILLEGSSGGGKTTLVSLLSGWREANSGLLLVNGLDRHVIGDKRWRAQVAAAPQFHENHILTETLAFNLLMGRRWPPTQEDMDYAEQVCRELGLGDLLDRMPSGLLQMVGEGGWQLSHGERSRIYIARALLQGAGLVILDESFAALDPENLRTALECTLERAETLLVVAHP
jgi:ATP-binding cassette, subfamily B, bacterial